MTGVHHSPPLAINRRMSSTLQAVVRGPSLTGAGYIPRDTPRHQLEREIGMIAGMFSLLSPVICRNLRKPVSGICVITFVAFMLRPFRCYETTGQSMKSRYLFFKSRGIMNRLFSMSYVEIPGFDRDLIPGFNRQTPLWFIEILTFLPTLRDTQRIPFL